VCSGGTINFDNDYTIIFASQLEIVNKSVTITGAGHNVTISSAIAGQFSIRAQPTSPVAASGTTTFTVRFTPLRLFSSKKGVFTANIEASNIQRRNSYGHN